MIAAPNNLPPLGLRARWLHPSPGNTSSCSSQKKPGVIHRLLDDITSPNRGFFGLKINRVVLALACTAAATVAAAGSSDFSTRFSWHDNVTNSEIATDILPALEFQFSAAGSYRIALTRNDAVLLTGRLSAETWPRYDGLDLTALGLRLVWQHKFGLGAAAPTLRAEFAGDAAAGRESGRTARAGTAALVYRQRFALLTRVELGHEWLRHDARQLAFDVTARELFARVSHQVGSAWEITLGARRRYGTTLSYSAPPRPDLVKLGKPITFVTTFDRATPWIAYYFNAHTDTLEARASRSFGRNLALVLSAEYRETSHGNSRYFNRVGSATLVRPF